MQTQTMALRKLREGFDDYIAKRVSRRMHWLSATPGVLNVRITGQQVHGWLCSTFETVLGH